MENKRYTSDGRELYANEYEFKNASGNIRYKFDKTINGNRIQKTCDDLDELRKIEAPYKNVFDIFNRADKVIKEYEHTKETKDSDVMTYDSPEFGKIRTVMIKGEPWFVGKDIAVALGYSNPNEAITDHVDAEDKLNSKSLLSLGQRGGWLINESGFYSLCLSSKLPSAKKFKRWVTSEVLPLIRKHGVYVDDETARKSSEEQLQILKKVEEEKQALRKQNDELTKENSNLKYDCKIKRDAYNGFSTISFTQLSSIYGISNAYSFLEKSGIVRKENGMIRLTDEYKNKGYDAIGWKGGKPFMLWTALGYCEVVYKTMLEQYGMKPIKQLYVF